MNIVIGAVGFEIIHGIGCAESIGTPYNGRYLSICLYNHLLVWSAMVEFRSGITLVNGKSVRFSDDQ